MKIGLDLDGTVYSFPEFFIWLIESGVERGHEFFCTSSHARSEWPDDCERLRAMGFDPDLISPDMMYPERHGDIRKKAQQADQLDMVFDDDGRVQAFTDTPIICPPNLKGRNYNFQRFL